MATLRRTLSLLQSRTARTTCCCSVPLRLRAVGVRFGTRMQTVAVVVALAVVGVLASTVPDGEAVVSQQCAIALLSGGTIASGASVVYSIPAVMSAFGAGSANAVKTAINHWWESTMPLVAQVNISGRIYRFLIMSNRKSQPEILNALQSVALGHAGKIHVPGQVGGADAAKRIESDCANVDYVLGAAVNASSSGWDRAKSWVASIADTISREWDRRTEL